MGEIYVHYGNLEDSVHRSQKVRNEISGYVDEIKRRITTPISQLSGSDSSGYASTAATLAWQKVNSLESKASRFSSYENSINNFISTAKSKDTYVSSQIETIAGMYVEKRNWFQKAGDWIFNTFCVDLANKWDFARDFTDAAKWIGDKVGNGLEKVVDWFTYGDGKYVLNIVTAVGAVVVAAVVAIAAIATAGTVLAVIAGICALISLGITLFNSEAKIISNAKALSLSGSIWDKNDGDPSGARYYGQINTLSDKWKRTDMGNAKTNENYELGGKIIDTTKIVADTGFIVCNAINSAFALRDYRFNNPDANIKKYSYTLKNFKHNLRGEFGFYLTKPGLQIKNSFKMIKTAEYIKDLKDKIQKQIEKGSDVWDSNVNQPKYIHSNVDSTLKELQSTKENLLSPLKLYKQFAQ